MCHLPIKAAEVERMKNRVLRFAGTALLIFTACGPVTANEGRPVIDPGPDIRVQGTSALERLTAELKPGIDWKQQGTDQLAFTLRAHEIMQRQYAGNSKCHVDRC